MKLKESLQIKKHVQLAKDTFLITFISKQIVNEIKYPGQFLQVSIIDKFLPRPISIADFDVATSEITLIYKTIGEGTKQLSLMKETQEVVCFGPLGNGFELEQLADATHVALVGGGIGVPPLYSVAKELHKKYPEKKITSILGFQNAESSFYQKEFAEFGDVQLMLDNGTGLEKGSVIDGLQRITCDFICSCGPNGMLAAIQQNFPDISGLFSLEERMACGYGVCMGCVKDGKRLCIDGPVLPKEAF